MAFASASDLITRFDVRLIGDLCSDDGVSLNQSEVLASPKVEAALEDASGEIAVALQTGGRYTLADLDGLTGYNESHLKRVNCGIAMYLLIRRRPIVNEDEAEKFAKQAREHLTRLSKGENVFGIPEIIESGQLHVSHMSTAQIDALNLLPSRMNRYFPDTAQRMPTGR